MDENFVKKYRNEMF